MEPNSVYEWLRRRLAALPRSDLWQEVRAVPTKVVMGKRAWKGLVESPETASIDPVWRRLPHFNGVRCDQSAQMGDVEVRIEAQGLRALPDDNEVKVRLTITEDLPPSIGDDL